MVFYFESDLLQLCEYYSELQCFIRKDEARAVFALLEKKTKEEITSIKNKIEESASCDSVVCLSHRSHDGDHDEVWDYLPLNRFQSLKSVFPVIYISIE